MRRYSNKIKVAQWVLIRGTDLIVDLICQQYIGNDCVSASHIIKQPQTNHREYCPVLCSTAYVNTVIWFIV